MSSSADKLKLMDAKHVPPHWARHRMRIRAALHRSGGTHDLATVFRMLNDYEAQWWANEEAFIVTEIANYPRKRVLRFALAGGDLAAVLRLHEPLLEWGRSKGCVEAEFNGRLGWHKVLPKEWKQRSETCVRML
jgi:hypothetical protein